MIDIDRLFSDRKFLDSEIAFFIRKKHVRRILSNPGLAKAHLEKSRHNMEFYGINKESNRFNDWLIVIMYYAVYHSALALLANKKFSSKNHHATILLLIREYGITRDEAEMINELSISKEDAELYTDLKSDRHNASYATDTLFSDQSIKSYESKVLDFINKAEEILHSI